MSEFLQICRALSEAASAGDPSWLASVVRVDGSAYRRPGAHLLFGQDGRLAGGLSGGCVERDVMRSGAWSCQRGAVVRHYDAREGEGEGGAGSRTGCGGALDVLLEPVTAKLARLFGVAAERLEAEQRVALATIVTSKSAGLSPAERLLHDGAEFIGDLAQTSAGPTLRAALSEALGAERSGADYADCGSFEVMLEVIEPPPHCFIFGSGLDAVPVAQFARLLDWRVTICGVSKRFDIGDRFASLARVQVAPLDACVDELNRCARPLAIVMGHDYEQDRSALASLLGSRARYVGVLGPARRTQRMLREIAELAGASNARAGRVHGPAGLHLGGETASEIALSMIAEAQAVLAGADGCSLRERRLGIHESPSPQRLRAEAT
jgi:xanthine dehydrogenase accessory factor